MAAPVVRNRAPMVRIGAVGYLNARPLTFCLPELVPEAQIVVDLPSRLADRLAAGELDVALVPSIEYVRKPGYRIVSDACVASDGPVGSIKLYSRVAVERIRTLALDEGSRTSAALTQIILKERFGLRPELKPLPVGLSLDDSTADAVMLIGDRAMLPVEGRFDFVWDLGEQWSQWTGLPMVFAMWVARSDVQLPDLGRRLGAARDEGIGQLEQIARREAPAIGISESQCLAYFRDNLVFRLGERQRRGLARFFELAGRHRLAPADAQLVLLDHSTR